MEILTAVLVALVAIAILYELARRLGVPYPTLFVLGGLGLAFVPGFPRIGLEPELVLLVFLPPLLFTAAVATPIRDLRANFAPLIWRAEPRDDPSVGRQALAGRNPERQPVLARGQRA